MSILNNSYTIYIKNLIGMPAFRLPINPIGDFQIQMNNKFDTVDVFGLGEVILKRNPSLQTIGWSSFFPSSEQDVRIIMGKRYTPDPLGQVRAFENSRNEILNLIIFINNSDGSTTPYINIDVIMKEFSPKLKGGEPEDIYYTIKFEEYIPPRIIKTKIEPPKSTGGNAITRPTGGNNVPAPNDKFSIGDIVKITGEFYEFQMEGKNVHDAYKTIVPASAKLFSYYTSGIKNLVQSSSTGAYLLQGVNGTIKKIDEGIDVKKGTLADIKANAKNPKEKFFYIQLSQKLERGMIDTLTRVAGVVINAILEVDWKKKVVGDGEIEYIYHIYCKESALTKIATKTGASYGVR